MRFAISLAPGLASQLVWDPWRALECRICPTSANRVWFWDVGFAGTAFRRYPPVLRAPRARCHEEGAVLRSDLASEASFRVSVGELAGHGMQPRWHVLAQLTEYSNVPCLCTSYSAGFPGPARSRPPRTANANLVKPSSIPSAEYSYEVIIIRPRPSIVTSCQANFSQTLNKASSCSPCSSGLHLPRIPSRPSSSIPDAPSSRYGRGLGHRPPTAFLP